MATQLQIRRGTSAQVAAFTGAEGEIVVNTTNDSVHVNDGSTAGGFELARVDGSNWAITNAISTTANISFGDNDKAIFGAGSDLQIYHTGSHSYISDQGTGNLRILAGDLRIRTSDDAEGMISATENAAVTLFYDGASKLATSSTGVDVTGVITTDGMTTSADINFGDNDKAVFGAGSDLQIYHDGSKSFISDTGTGVLAIQGENTIVLEETDGTNYATFTKDSAVTLYYAGASKLATTSTGIDVTGTVVSDGLTVDGVANFNANNINYTGSSPRINFFENDATDVNSQLINTLGDFFIRTVSDDAGTTTNRFSLDHATGDISFYNSAGTSQSLFWDSSAESLGIGTTSPDRVFHVSRSSASVISGKFESASTSGSQIVFKDADTTTNDLQVRIGSDANDLVQYAGGSERMRILSTGGITFNGDTAQANALDDYEEGTFTMSLHDAASGGNQSSTSKTAYYTKIGNQVTVYAHALNNIDTTGMTAGNSLYFALPFTSSSTGRAVGSVIHHGFTYDGDSENEDMKPYVATNNSRGLFATVGYGRADGSVKVSDVSSGVDDIHTFTLTYFV